MLHGPQHDLGLGREARDVEARLEAKAGAHGREGGIAAGPGLVARRPQIARVGRLRRHADGMGDLARLHLVVAQQPRQDGQAGRVGPRPSGRSQRVGAEVPDRPGPRRRTPCAVVGVVELVERARGGVEHDGVAVARRALTSLDGRVGAEGVGPRSLSLAYWKATLTRDARPRPPCRACRRGSTGHPRARSRDAGAWSTASMLASHCGRWTSTGSEEMSVFQMLSDGNIGHPGAPGSGVPAAALVALEIDAALEQACEQSRTAECAYNAHGCHHFAPLEPLVRSLIFAQGHLNGCTYPDAPRSQAARRWPDKPQQ